MSEPTSVTAREPVRALVTGASGYVGSQLVCRLIERGASVSVVTRPESSLSALADVHGRFDVHVHDGTTEGMVAIVGAARPSIVYHLASRVLGQHAPADVEPLIRSNVLFGTQLLEAMRVHGVRSLVNTGTFWQYFAGDGFDPVSLYAATKQAFEALVVYYARAHGLRCLTLVLFDTYGPRDPRPKLLSLLQNAAARGERLELSPGLQRIDLVYIDDVIDAYEAASAAVEGFSDGELRSYDVAAGRPATIREVVTAFEQASSCTLDVHWGGRPYRPREIMEPRGVGTRLPGWSAPTALVDGLRRTLAG